MNSRKEQIAWAMALITISILGPTTAHAESLTFKLATSGEPTSQWLIYVRDGTAKLERAAGKVMADGFEVSSEQTSEQQEPSLAAAILLTLDGRIISSPLTPTDLTGQQSSPRQVLKQHIRDLESRHEQLQNRIRELANSPRESAQLNKLVDDLLRLDGAVGLRIGEMPETKEIK